MLITAKKKTGKYVPIKGLWKYLHQLNIISKKISPKSIYNSYKNIRTIN